MMYCGLGLRRRDDVLVGAVAPEGFENVGAVGLMEWLRGYDRVGWRVLK